MLRGFVEATWWKPVYKNSYIKMWNLVREEYNLQDKVKVFK